MAIKYLDYWYDGQQRRFLEQVVRAFSGFQYSSGADSSGNPQLVRVPCRLQLTNLTVAQILQNGSTNSLMTAPMIIISQTGMKYDPSRASDISHVSKVQVIERKIVDGAYTNERGNSYTVERIMPRPWDMNISVQVLTSNQDQMYQLQEQIMAIFVPQIEIQNSDNPLDWTALTIMKLEDVEFNSRTIPVGSSSEALNITTFNFTIPIWISPPAKVKQQKIIEQIITNIYDNTGLPLSVSGTLLDRIITTPGDHFIEVIGNKIYLRGPKNRTVGEDGLPYKWYPLIKQYGSINPLVSSIRLKTSADLDDITTDIVGVIQYDPSDGSALIWNIEPNTLPTNTLVAIDGVINPRKTYPGNGLPNAITGTRYLLQDSISGPQSIAWGTLAAVANDIITYNGSSWVVDFHPTKSTKSIPAPIHYVVNNATGKQLKWDGSEWIYTIEGTYAPGMWRLGDLGV